MEIYSERLSFAKLISDFKMLYKLLKSNIITTSVKPS